MESVKEAECSRNVKYENGKMRHVETIPDVSVKTRVQNFKMHPVDFKMCQTDYKNLKLNTRPQLFTEQQL
jgi:hypothetical protein